MNARCRVLAVNCENAKSGDRNLSKVSDRRNVAAVTTFQRDKAISGPLRLGQCEQSGRA